MPTPPSRHTWIILGSILATVGLLASCSTSGDQTLRKRPLDRETFSGDLRNYSYEIRIWWRGMECERREIRMKRRCGLCKDEVARAAFYDHDCDGRAEQFSHRLGQDETVAYADLEEEAWHAFYHIVPPSRSGETRTINIAGN